MPVITLGTAALTALGTAAASTAAASGAAAAGAGLGTAATGAAVGSATAAGASAASAASWAAGTTVTAAGTGGLGTAIGGAGTALSLTAEGGKLVQGQMAAREQARQEGLRMKQMGLEADRQRREVIRQTQIAQAIGLNNAANSGADIQSGSSVTSGVIGQNTANQGFAINSINENEAIGNALFSSNAQESGYNSTASLFGGVSNFGQSLASNNMQISRLATTLFG